MSNPYKNEVMIIFLKEMLELTNFGHMTISTAQFQLYDNVTDVSYDFIIFISKIKVISRKPGVFNFTDNYHNCNHVD